MTLRVIVYHSLKDLRSAVGITSHELLHAAVWMRELAGHNDPLTTANDETLCWILGDLVRQTVNLLNNRGIYDDEGGP